MNSKKIIEAKQEQEQAARKNLEATQQSLEDARSQAQTAREKLSKIQAEINAQQSVLKSETQEGIRPVLEDVKADEVFEGALSKALGDTLMASTEASAPMIWMKNTTHDRRPAALCQIQPDKVGQVVHCVLTMTVNLQSWRDKLTSIRRQLCDSHDDQARERRPSDRA